MKYLWPLSTQSPATGSPRHLNELSNNPLPIQKTLDYNTSASKTGLFSMETAFPAVHTLPAETLALAALPELGLMQKCEVPPKLPSLIHPLNSACSLLGRAEGRSAGESRATHRSKRPRNPRLTGTKSQWKIQGKG